MIMNKVRSLTPHYRKGFLCEGKTEQRVEIEEVEHLKPWIRPYHASVIMDQPESGAEVLISSLRFFVFTDRLLNFMIRSQTDILTYTSEQVSPLDV